MSLSLSPVGEAIRGLGLALRAVSLYPSDHPALSEALQRSLALLAGVTGPDVPLVLAVRREAFWHQGVAVDPAHVLLRKLARHCFVRKVEDIVILADVDAASLESFCRLLAREPDELTAQGGLTQLLPEAGISQIWINETDLEKILTNHRGRAPLARQQPASDSAARALERRRETAAVSAIEPRDTPPRPKLHELLALLELAESDDEYLEILDELHELLLGMMEQAGLGAAMEGLGRLALYADNDSLSARRRKGALGTLRSLAGPAVIDALARMIVDDSEGLRLEQPATEILRGIGEPAAAELLDQLAREPQARRRRGLARLLGALGDAAMPALCRALRDERWFVVRNALAILGSLNAQGQVRRIAECLSHKDQRVRREAIRALTRMATAEAMEILLRAVAQGSPELQQEALPFLGATRNQEALPYLIEFLDRKDPLLRQAGLIRGAAQALGEIGAQEAVPALASLLMRRKLIRRARFLDIQRHAAEALARIGGETARQALEQASQYAPRGAAHLAARALQSMKMGKRTND